MKFILGVQQLSLLRAALHYDMGSRKNEKEASEFQAVKSLSCVCELQVLGLYISC